MTRLRGNFRDSSVRRTSICSPRSAPACPSNRNASISRSAIAVASAGGVAAGSRAGAVATIPWVGVDLGPASPPGFAEGVARGSVLAWVCFASHQPSRCPTDAVTRIRASNEVIATGRRSRRIAISRWRIAALNLATGPFGFAGAAASDGKRTPRKTESNSCSVTPLPSYVTSRRGQEPQKRNAACSVRPSLNSARAACSNFRKRIRFCCRN